MVMKRPPISVTATLIFILLNATIWFVFAFLVIFNAIQSIPTTGIFKWIIIILAMGASWILAGIAVLLKRHMRVAFYAGIAMLAIIAILSLADQVGWLDLFSLLISLVPIILMLKDRTWYFQ